MKRAMRHLQWHCASTTRMHNQSNRNAASEKQSAWCIIFLALCINNQDAQLEQQKCSF
jgi:hypothetical protein